MKFMQFLKRIKQDHGKTERREAERRDTRNTGPEPITDPALAREVDRKMAEAIRREQADSQ